MAALFQEQKEQQRTRAAMRAGLVGVLCNLCLCALKIAAGVFTGAVSVTADGLNNLSDAGSSAVSLASSYFAGKKADKDHPFGHGRIEYIAAFVVSVFIICAGVSALREALQILVEGRTMSFSALTAGILVLSILVKLAMGVYYGREADRIDSSVLRASAADSFQDCFSTAAALASLLLFRFFSLDVDAPVGLVVSAAVIVSGIRIARETLEPLIGSSVDPALYYEIEEFVGKYDGILGVHDLIVHSYGHGICMATIHAELDGRRSLKDVHDVIDLAEKECEKKLGVKLVIHADPVEEDPDTLKCRTLTLEILKKLSPESSLHDFHIRRMGQRRVTLIFDLVTPWEMPEKKEHELVQDMIREFEKRGIRASCEVRFDKPYMHVHSDEEERKAETEAAEVLSGIAGKKEEGE